MARVSRTPVTILHPLSQRQIDYLTHVGHLAGADAYKAGVVWWLRYFAQADGDPLPLDAWEDPGCDVSNKAIYLKYVKRMTADLNAARTNVSQLRNLQAHNLLPPNLNSKDPYSLPSYFGWWQAENAFRRGFLKAYETEFLETFKQTLKSYFHQDGNILTRNTMERIAEREYDEDPVIAKFFKDLNDAVTAGQPSPYSSLKALYADLLKIRERSYQQFSPYFIPLRWLPGAGLVGVEPE